LSCVRLTRNIAQPLERGVTSVRARAGGKRATALAAASPAAVECRVG